MKTCPKCGLVHSDSVSACECKYVFSVQAQAILQESNKFDKFRGWLLFFAIVTWINLILSMSGLIIYGYLLIKNENSNELILNLLWTIDLSAMMMFTIFILKTIKVRELESIIKIIKYLRLGLIITAILSIGEIGLDIHLKNNEAVGDLRDLFRQAAGVAIWTSYFRKSKRVRYYYEKNEKVTTDSLQS